MNESRLFLAVAIGSGLENGMISPEDLIEHANMDVLAHHLPTQLKAQLLTAALSSDKMDAILILDTLGVDAFAEHAPLDVLWNCVRAAACRELGTEESKPTTNQGLGPQTSLPPPPTKRKSSSKRKPNRNTRVRAGATSRPTATNNPVVLPNLEDEDISFDVVTRVGGQISEADIAEEASIYQNQADNDDVTIHGGGK